jgi:succinoglycan biosynthesis protein ExoA
MSGSLPTVSIIVPCRNERDHIETCIKSILCQKPPLGGFEIIVSDGMSDDGTRHMLERFEKMDPRMRIIDNPVGIVSTGLNKAIRIARGRIILRMDAHAEYAEDYVRQCVAVLKETGADNVGGACRPIGRGVVGEAIAAAFRCPLVAGGARGHDPDYEGVADTVFLGCWPREVFHRIGLFDEELVRNQDDEFNLRLTKAGGRVWQSSRIRCLYHSRDSLGALFLQYRQYGYWKVRVIQKNRALASIRHLVPGLFLMFLVLLSVTALLWPPMAWGWLLVVSWYVSLIGVASVHTAARNARQHLPILPLVISCYHFAYGYGFLRGVLDFFILRRRPCSTYTMQTRV